MGKEASGFSHKHADPSFYMQSPSRELWTILSFSPPDPGQHEPFSSPDTQPGNRSQMPCFESQVVSRSACSDTRPDQDMPHSGHMPCPAPTRTQAAPYCPPKLLLCLMVLLVLVLKDKSGRRMEGSKQISALVLRFQMDKENPGGAGSPELQMHEREVLFNHHMFLYTLLCSPLCKLRQP